ncbi:MAG: hypothetical protein IT445_18465 [Phycisphaeraceae bacterium]|nr:hypothetical protein [Phycisphaeraceae bacterium]
MNFREVNLAVFRGDPLPHVFFQPRFEPWYAWHRDFGSMPAAYADMTLPQLYDHCGASMRYVQYYTGMPAPIVCSYRSPVTVERRENEHENVVVYHTPQGDLVDHQVRTQDRTWRRLAFPVRDREGLIALRYLFEHADWMFSKENFAQGDAYIADRGWPCFWVPKSPYFALAMQWMKFDDFCFAMADCPDVVEDTMRAIDDSYDPLYEQLVAAEGVRIVNFGENVHEQLLSPAWWEKYLMPFYTKRCAQLHAAGIFTHIHVDGYFQHMLSCIRHLPQHGVEALTPQPQGDMTIEQIHEHIGDKILLDGIPAVLFLEDLYSREQLMAVVEKLVRLFHPRLVLGASDEVPEGAGQEAIERVRMIGRWCAEQRLQSCAS